MADRKVSELPSVTRLDANDVFMVITSFETRPTSNKIKALNLFANVSTDVGFTGTVNVEGDSTFRGSITISNNGILDCSSNSHLVLGSSTPASNNASGSGKNAGEIWFDANYLYIATDESTVKRVALSDFDS